MKARHSALVAILFSIIASSIFAADGEIVLNGRAFNWVNPLANDSGLPPGLLHSTFISATMQEEVGYAIYLPPQYNESPDARFPVIYYLHGGWPGNETRSVALSNFIHDAMSKDKVAPAIYVYVNGGILSHYNYPPLNSMGEDLLIK